MDTKDIRNYLPVEFLQPGKFQPRKDFAKEALQELAASIREHGIIEPIVVRPLSHNVYEIIAGERRWRAAQLSQLHEVPCIIENYTDEQAAAITIIENIQRADLNPIEEAQAYQNLIDVFNYTHDEIAKQVGKARSKITNALRLLKLDKAIQKNIREGQLSEGHGKILAGLSLRLQIMAAKECIEKGWSVRKLEIMARKYQHEGTLSTSHKTNYVALERALSDHIGCNVKLDFNEEQGGKGRLIVEYHNLDILEGVFEKLKFKSDKF